MEIKISDIKELNKEAQKALKEVLHKINTQQGQFKLSDTNTIILDYYCYAIKMRTSDIVCAFDKNERVKHIALCNGFEYLGDLLNIKCLNKYLYTGEKTVEEVLKELIENIIKLIDVAQKVYEAERVWIRLFKDMGKGLRLEIFEEDCIYLGGNLLVHFDGTYFLFSQEYKKLGAEIVEVCKNNTIYHVFDYIIGLYKEFLKN